MDQTNRPLTIPPDFANYAEKFGLFDLFKRLLCALIVNKPEDPLNYIIEFLQQDDDDVPQIMVIGPPASGKRSIARMLCKQFGAQHVTMEGLLQEADAHFRKEVQVYINKGEKIPADLWAKLVKSRLDVFDAAKKGWVMDSIMHSREEVLALSALGHFPKHCVILDALDSVLIERAAGKRIDPKTGDIYHMTFEMPSTPEVIERLVPVKDYSETKLVDELITYRRNINGIKSCYQSFCKIFNADQPKADIFSQVMTFVCQPPRTPAPYIPRIIFIGPFGCGKTYQSNLLAKKYKIDSISSGNLIKQAIADDTALGRDCKSYLDRTLIIPEEVILELVKQRLSQLDCSARGWVLHGFPKTREQAERLDASEHYANRIFFFDIPNDSVMERMTMRATDPVTGERLHMLYNPPRTQEIKDRLMFDPKDAPEIIHKELLEYRAEEEMLKAYYKEGLHVNAEQDTHRVFECIESQLVCPLPKCHAQNSAKI